MNTNFMVLHARQLGKSTLQKRWIEMQHKHAELFIALANDASTQFICYGCPEPRPVGLQAILNYPEWNWSIYKPEKWQKEKEAFARGEVIQWRSTDGWSDCRPDWDSDDEYRIKPKTVTKWLWASNDGQITSAFFKTQPLSDFPTYPIKLEWSATEFEVTE